MSSLNRDKTQKLGRGLEALIPKSFLNSGKTILTVRVGEVKPSPLQPRKVFDSQELQSLARSIRSNGIIQPLVVRRVNEHYELIAGERRLRASVLAGLETVPVVVRDVTDKEVLKLALIENIHRDDLNALEIAEGYHRLIEEFGLTHLDVASIFNKSRSAITNSLRLLNLSDAVKQALFDGKISEGHARSIASQTAWDEQNQLLTAVLNQGLNVRETEAANQRLKPAKTKARLTQLSQRLEQLQLDLQHELNLPVSIKGTEKSGAITLKYKNETDLQRIKLALIAAGLN